MGEIIGAGVTHHPGFVGPDDNLCGLLRFTLKSGKVPERLRNVSSWPKGMQEEWGTDDGLSAAKEHRKQIWQGFSAVREKIDTFRPDFLLIWGDDQYEQFQEDCVPPFNVFILDQVTSRPYEHPSPVNPREKNVWNDPIDKSFTYRGHVGAGYLTQKLLEEGFDISYSYKVRDGLPLPHSFLNTMLYLDHDRRGFDYPIVPFHVNCYGSSVIRSRGATGHLQDGGSARGFDPISPTPRRCFEVGQATARILRDSPWRVALIASSSWSHAFLTEKNGWIYPDMEADRRCFEYFESGKFEGLRDLSLKQIEESGQQEVLNWCCLAGAMYELKGRPKYLEYIQSYIFNSNKLMAVFEPSRPREVTR